MRKAWNCEVRSSGQGRLSGGTRLELSFEGCVGSETKKLGFLAKELFQVTKTQPRLN
jgi:hypothetical protein